MVYRGKPSLACHSCRQRRIKCDQLRPGCTQCANVRTQCPGYRDVLEMSFLDETQHVTQKAQRKQQSKSNSGSPSSDQDSLRRSPSIAHDGTLVRQGTDSPPIPRSLEQSIAYNAISFFMSSYASSSRYDYLPSLYLDASDNSALSLTVRAVAVANFARETQNGSLLAHARQHYAQGLVKTNAALRKPGESTHDTTLVSVLLLGLYESLMQEGRQSPVRWTAHTNGAVALLYERGTRQFHCALGKKLFLQISENIRASCAQQAVPMPPAFLELEEKALPFFDPDDPIIRLNIIADEFAELRALGAWANWGNPDLLLRLVELDGRFANALDTLPVQYDCSVRPATPGSTPHILSTATHEFPDHHVAKIWNTVRMMRLYLNVATAKHSRALLLLDSDSSCPTPTASPWHPVHSTALANLSDLTSSILASVPQFTRLRPDGTLPYIAAAGLVWPLTTIADADFTPPATRAWIVRQLRFLGEGARLAQARWAADMLEEKGPLEDWQVFFAWSAW